jgi:hypothetical protein
MDKIKRGLANLTNEQLAKKVRSVPNDDHEAYINSKSISEIVGENENDSDYDGHENISMNIGIKPGESIFEIPGITDKNKRAPIPRQDGVNWTHNDQMNHPYYGKEWIDNEKDRKMIIQNDPNYRFMTLIAGFTKYATEDLYVDEQNVSLRNSFYEAQQRSKTKASNNPEAVRNLISSKETTEIDLSNMVARQKVALDQASKVTKPFMDALEKFQRVFDLTDPELFFPYILENGGSLKLDSFAQNNGGISSAVRKLSQYIWKHMSPDKGVLVDEIFGKMSTSAAIFGPSTDAIRDSLELPQTATRDEIITKMKIMTKSQYETVISILTGSNTTRADTALYMYRYFESVFSKMSFKAAKITKWSEVSQFLRQGSGSGPGLMIEVVQQFISFFTQFKATYALYDNPKSGVYRAGESVSVLLVTKESVLKRFKKVTQEVSEFLSKYTVESASGNPADKLNAQNNFFASRLDSYPMLGDPYQASIKTYNEMTTFTKTQFESEDIKTALFNAIEVSTQDILQDEVRKTNPLLNMEEIKDSAKENPYLYFQYYNEMLVVFLTREIAEGEKNLALIRGEIASLRKYQQDIITGQQIVKIPEIEYPYRQKPSWVLNPRHSGLVELKPIVVSAISDARKMLHTHVDPYIPSGNLKLSEVDFEALQNLDLVSTSLAKLVATCMQFPSINFPEQYRFRDSAFMAQKNLSDVLKELRSYRIKRQGRRKYIVKIEQRKDPLAF